VVAVPGQWSQDFENLLRRHLPEAGPDRPLSTDARLFDLGLDSFGTVELLVALEHTFDVLLPDEALTEETFFTAGSLWQVVSGLLEPTG
jgi:nodulation protein F